MADPSAARVLLRALNDPAALRAHPLAARFFDPSASAEVACARIRALVRAALPDGSRGRTIVERCDLGGENHKSAMFALGLSRRQFYRERRRAAERVAAALAEPAIESVRTPSDELNDRVLALRSMLDDGHARAVAEAAGVLLDGDVPEDVAVRLLLLRAASQGQCGDAAEMHADVRAICARSRAPLVESEVLTLQADQEALYGRYATSLALMDRAVAGTAIAAPLPVRDRRVHARVLQRRGAQRREAGAIDGALADFAAAQEMLELLPRVPLDDRAQVLTDLAFTRLSLKGQTHRAWGEASEACGTTAYHGLRGRHAWSLLALALVASTRGNADEAAAYGRSAMPLIRSALAAEPFARAALRVARLELTAGRLQRATAILHEARPHMLAGGFVAACALFVESEIACAAGEFARARILAEESLAIVMSRCSDSHYVGRAFVAAARARHALGDDAAAAEFLEAGMARLRRGAMLLHLADALSLQAEVLHSDGPRREAREVLQAVAM